MRVIVLKKNRANKRGTPAIRELPSKKVIDKVSILNNFLSYFTKSCSFNLLSN